MRVAIAGGHGRIALELTRLLAERGDEVVGLIRDSSQNAEIEAAGGTAAVVDLESAGADAIADAIAGADAVVFAAGAGPGSGPERKWTVDRDGAVKLIAAAKRADVQRYLMISSMSADPEHEGDEVFDVYLRAKGAADAALARSGLDYTIVRPGRLTDDEPTGRVRVGTHIERGEIPRGDVAAVLAACLRSDAVSERSFELTTGEVPITEAL